VKSIYEIFKVVHRGPRDHILVVMELVRDEQRVVGPSGVRIGEQQLLPPRESHQNHDQNQDQDEEVTHHQLQSPHGA